MKIGYACLIVDEPLLKYRTLRKRNLNEERFNEIVLHNLDVLDRMIDYNIANDIKLFRITSDLIPFATITKDLFKWPKNFEEKFKAIGLKIKKAKIRVSMHPGQYTVLNSNNNIVVANAIDDLVYHCLVLDLLQVPLSCKIVIHIGGIYGNKKEAIKRFVENFYCLNDNIKKRLVIENDEKSYTVEDVLEISKIIKIPVVFDNLHHQLNPSGTDEIIMIKKCLKTWKKVDGNPKIHYSQQDSLKKGGAHSKTINVKEFNDFVKKLPKNIDIMLEVKDKNESVLKCKCEE